MTVSELIKKAQEVASTHILKKGSFVHELLNGDSLECCVSSSSARHSGQSWGKVNFYMKKNGAKKYSRFSKSKAIELIGI